jgi:hypothetical protein
MVQWKSLLERFMRNECTARENKIVYHALSDGVIDDEFCCAIDAVMNDEDTLAYIDRMEPVSENILKNICRMLKKYKTKPVAARCRRLVPEWLKIVATVAVTLSVWCLTFYAKTPKEETLMKVNL